MPPLIGNATSPNEVGVYGDSTTFNGVRGISFAPGHGGVVGISEVHNPDPNNHPENNAGPGVYGKSQGTGVWGESETWHGVAGLSESRTGGAGIYGKGEQLAALFEGPVRVRDGNIVIENNFSLNIGGKDIMLLIETLSHRINTMNGDIRKLEQTVNELKKTT